MSEKRLIYVDQIISELKSLENGLLTAKKNEALPFSFFKESFAKTQNISRMLHELEFMQVDDMKDQMERLVKFLSENEVKSEPDEHVENTPEVSSEDDSNVVEVAVEEPQYTGNVYAKGIELPEYHKNHQYQAPKVTQVAPIAPVAHVTPVVREVLMDEIKRGISLNDRFLYQRELFNNSRAEMDATFEKLNSFESYEQAEDYLKESKSWNFEDSTVGDFLLVIKKGFK